MPDDTSGGGTGRSSTDEQFARATEQAVAEKARLEAQKARLDLEKAELEIAKLRETARQAAEPSARARQERMDESSAAKQRAEARKADADASKARSDARKAELDAEAAALKAAIGEVPEPPYKGDVTLTDHAGKTEATLLVADAVRQAAKAIAARARMATARPVLLLAQADAPTFQNLLAFRAHAAIVEKALERAIEQSTQTQADVPSARQRAAPVAVAGLALEAADRILGFFRTDYTVGGVEVATDDGLLLSELAGVLTEKGWTVSLPKLYDPSKLASADSLLVGRLTSFAATKADAIERAEVHDASAATLAAAAAKSGVDDAAKEQATRGAARHRETADALRKAVGLLDAWTNTLVTADESTGAIQLARMLEEEALRAQLMGGTALLLVKLHGAGGTFFTAKNIWTVFGRMPFHHAGGVVATFALIDGASGAVLDAATIPLHGGFVRTVDMPAKFRLSGAR